MPEPCPLDTGESGRGVSPVGAKVWGVADALLDRAIYSYPEVDRLVGLHPGTAKRWLEG